MPNSVNIGLGGQFASWAGTLIPIGTPIAIIAETQDQVDEAVTRLARVGHENATYFFLISDYSGDIRKVGQVSVDLVDQLIRDGGKIQFVDVRRASEHAASHAPQTTDVYVP